MTNAAHILKIMWKMAKGEITKIGFMKKQFWKKRGKFVCWKMIGLAANLPSRGMWHASWMIFFHTVF